MGDKSIKECPKRPGVVTIQVVEQGSWKEVSGCKVKLTGPTSGEKDTNAQGDAVWEKASPGDGYKVSVSVAHLSKFQDHDVRFDKNRAHSDSKEFTLSPGGSVDLVFGIHPPVGTLEVRVVNKDTGELIPDVKFPIVVPKPNRKDTSALTGSKNFELPPDTYEEITVDLAGPELAGRYKLIESGKATVTAGKTAVATVKLEVKVIRLISVDHHFVPGTDKNEHLRIRYDLSGFADSKVLVQVLSDQHNPALVFERELTAEEKSNGSGKVIEWDGKTNCTAGPLQGKYVNPLLGKLKVRLSVPATNIRTDDRDQTATRVLVHSLKLVAGSYIEDSRRPPAKVHPIPASGTAQWADHIKWVQYQLNSLGYFAGVVNGVLNDQTKRAIKRYTYEMVNSQEHDRADDPAFVRSLGSFELLHMFMSDWGVIEDKARSSKVYIQHNYFYHTEGSSGTSNYNLPDGHWHKESDYTDPKGGKLDRFELPIQAEATLESRDQKTYSAAHAGVKSPEAVGELEVEWTAVDPPEDLSVLPTYAANSPTNSHGYIKAVRAKVTGVANPTTTTGGDNCPVDCGGFDRDFFGQVLPSFPIRAGAGPDKAISKVHQDSSRHRPGLGATTVLFRGSHIGGDNYIVRAAVTFDGKSNKAALESEHTAFQGSAFDKNLVAETGTMTVWRKRRVSAVVNWTDKSLPPVDWSEIVPQFSAAFIDLDVASTETRRIDHYVKDNTDAGPYLDIFAAEAQNDIMRDNKVARSNLVFAAKHMIPFPDSAFERGKDEKESKDPAKDRLRSRIGGIGTNVNGKLGRLMAGSDTQPSVGDWLANLIRRTRRPGHIVLRLTVFKGVSITRTTGLFKKTTKIVEADFGSFPGMTCIGVGGGTAVIAEGRSLECKDGFLTAHEMAHCLYLSHPFDGLNPKFPDRRPPWMDHDTTDKGCTMWYHQDTQPARRPLLKGAKSPQRPMAKGSEFRTKFCGKCLLKLRGWKVGDKLFTMTPESGPIDWQATPVNPRMVSEGYALADGEYKTVGGELVACSVGATDPKDTGKPKILLGPLKFIHPHRLTWESSDGSLASLAIVETRERVEYQAPTQDAPFSAAADPDQIFVQDGEPGSSGWGLDLHSVTLPSLICRYPLQRGELIGYQKYQYKPPKGKWTDIPEAAFLLRKIVYQNTTTGEWVFKFVKENWTAHNPNKFYFEVQYKIGSKPFRLPLTEANPNADATATNYKIQSSPLGAIFASGPTKAGFNSKSSRSVTLEELSALGLLASEPWE